MRNMYSLMTKLQVLKRPFRINTLTTYNGGQTPEEQTEDSSIKFEKSVNEVRLVGRVGKDPWLGTTQGKNSIHFILGTRTAVEEGLDVPGLEWHFIYTQNPVLIKSIKLYVKKGMKLYVSGKLSYLPEKKTVNVMLYRYICFS